MSARLVAAIALMVLGCVSAAPGLAQAPPAPAAPAAAATPAAPVRPPPVRGEAIAAIVNDEVISTFDVNQRTLLLLITSGIQPTEEILRQVRETALRSLIDEHLQMQEAKRTETKVDPRQIDAALQDFAVSNRTTLDVVERQLGSAGVGIATLRKRFEATQTWNRVVMRMYGQRVRISESQVAETLNRLSEYATKTQYDVLAILIPVDRPQEQAEAEKGALSLIDAIKKGAPFAQVAKQFSALPSSANGGELGWLADSEIAPAELRPVIEKMQPGTLAGPIPGAGGFYILALRAKRDGGAVSHKVTLKQISAPAAQRGLVDTLRRRVRGCETVDAAVAGQAGVEAADLGETDEKDLADDTRDQIARTAVGTASEVFESDGKARSLVVCARDSTGSAVPTRQQVENQLETAEYEMLSERHLRNLRREATIISR